VTMNGVTFKKFFDVSMLSMSTLQQLIDLKASLQFFIPILNFNVLSESDVVRRGNQVKYNSLYQCNFPSSALGSTVLKSGYCMPNTVRYYVGVAGYGTLSTSLGTYPSGSYTTYFQGIQNDYDSSKTFSTLVHHPNTIVNSPQYAMECSLEEKYCLPQYLKVVDASGKVSYKSIGFYYFENPDFRCPAGLVYDGGQWAGGADVQFCRPAYESDAVTPNYWDFFSNNLGDYPEFEVYPDLTIHNHPKIADSISAFGNSYYPNVSIYNGTILSYTKQIDQNISVDIAFKFLDKNSFLISRTINGLKLLRSGNIEISLVIRDLLQFDSDFKLMDRNFSFVTQDGFDIAVGTTALSPKTYGITGKTIAEQFGILTLATDVVLPESNTSNGSDSIVPCGLNKEVEVLRTRKNAQTGKDENYYSKEPSPACAINWGKASNAKDVKDFETAGCKKEGEEGYDPNCKESDAFKTHLNKLTNVFSFDSDNFRLKNMVLNTCSPFEFDLSGIEISFLGNNLLQDISKKHIINSHCDLIDQNPLIETFFRISAMIGWFIFALFKLLST